MAIKNSSRLIMGAAIFSFTFSNIAFSQTNNTKTEISKVWVADNGNGTYKNPILFADYSDPDGVRIGDDYFMTSSSFNCVPGLPVLHSKDMVNWEIVSYGITRLVPEEFFSKPQHGKGVWAPCMRHHNGTTYIFWGDPDYGIYYVKTNNPFGKWEEPVLIKPGKGLIDATVLFDEDGRVYLAYAYARSRANINSVVAMNELDPETLKPISEDVLVYDGYANGDHTIEGPKLYKKDGYYYIMAPAGGVKTGWQLAMRSKNIWGPYESKHVMEQGDTEINGPHQGAWITAQDGRDWFLHFQDRGAYGRITHLNPVNWIDGWPVMGTVKDQKYCGYPVTTFDKPVKGETKKTPQESDEFNSHKLGLQWSWHANPQDTWGYPSTNGYYRLYAQPLPEGFKNFWDVPNLLLQKFPAETFTATTKLELLPQMDYPVEYHNYTDKEKAGLIVMGMDYSYVALVRDGDKFKLQQVICKKADKGSSETIVKEIPVKSNKIELRVSVKKDAVCKFSYSENGKNFKEFGEPFTAREGRWIGAKIGLFAVMESDNGNKGWADIDYFRITK